jgi:hypothetical protein
MLSEKVPFQQAPEDNIIDKDLNLNDFVAKLSDRH